MAEKKAGFLIRFDEAQRATFLREIHTLEDGFSDALSNMDWAVREWEVCGLMFKPETITHWALARRGKKVASGKVRVDFTEIVATEIHLAAVEQKVGAAIRNHIVGSRSGVGGKVPPGSWEGLKQAVRQISPASLAALERLELLRDQSREFISRPGMSIVAQQRDAVGLALDVFDQAGQLRKNTLRSWTAPAGEKLTSFLEGLAGVRTVEDQLIARDAAKFPGAESVSHTVVGAIFRVGGRKLEVFNVNRSPIESAVGVDLVYFNDSYKSWTLIQYKCMEKSTNGNVATPIYRPDGSFDSELDRMRKFRKSQKDSWKITDGLPAYRLCGDGFFFKFCPRIQLEVLSESLLPGMYLPREFVEATLTDLAARGPHGGRLITFENTGRHLSNTLFADLMREGWVGTRGISSEQIAAIVKQGLAAERAIVIARSRPSTAGPNPNETLKELKI